MSLINLKEIFEIVVHIFLAVFGVTARELRYLDIRNLEIAKLIASMIVATFGGTIVYLSISMLNLPLQAGYITAGLVGWGGPKVLDRIFEKQTGIAPIEEKDGKEEESAAEKYRDVKETKNKEKSKDYEEIEEIEEIEENDEIKERNESS